MACAADCGLQGAQPPAALGSWRLANPETPFRSQTPSWLGPQSACKTKPDSHPPSTAPSPTGRSTGEAYVRLADASSTWDAVARLHKQQMGHRYIE